VYKIAASAAQLQISKLQFASCFATALSSELCRHKQ